MAKRFVLMLGIVGLGLLAGGYFGHVGALLNSGFYAPVVTAFLALGLYGSTHAIDLKHLRADLRTVVLAVTVGVVLKAALISAVMLAFFPRPGSLVLGIAVAQIDPLSVVALGRSSRLSSRGRGLLLAWASFDDPVTTLLTIYVAALALSARHDGSSAALDLGGPGSFALDLLGNLLLAGVVFLLYRWVRRFRPWPRLVVTCLLLAGTAAIAIWQVWMLAVALVGLVARPVVPGRPLAVGRLLDRAVDLAFVGATALLGLILALGISPGAGLVLGLAAFCAQAVVSLPLTRSQSTGDTVYLALAQQNGITAIVLALLLEPAFAGTVAVVAPAILVINLLYLVTNAAYARRAPSVAVEPAGARAGEGLAHPVPKLAEQPVHIGLPPRAGVVFDDRGPR
jgi:hypothetical protein